MDQPEAEWQWIGSILVGRPTAAHNMLYKRRAHIERVRRRITATLTAERCKRVHFKAAGAPQPTTYADGLAPRLTTSSHNYATMLLLFETAAGLALFKVLKEGSLKQSDVSRLCAGVLRRNAEGILLPPGLVQGLRNVRWGTESEFQRITSERGLGNVDGFALRRL
jgi:hypothetical protein